MQTLLVLFCVILITVPCRPGSAEDDFVPEINNEDIPVEPAQDDETADQRDSGPDEEDEEELALGRAEGATRKCKPTPVTLKRYRAKMRKLGLNKLKGFKLVKKPARSRLIRQLKRAGKRHEIIIKHKIFRKITNIFRKFGKRANLFDLCTEHHDTLVKLVDSKAGLVFQINTITCKGNCHYSLFHNMGSCQVRKHQMLVYLPNPKGCGPPVPQIVDVGVACECKTFTDPSFNPLRGK